MEKWKKIVAFPLIILFSTVGWGQTIQERVLDFHLSPMFSRINSCSDLIEANGINVGLKVGTSVNFKMPDCIGVVGGMDFALWPGGNLLFQIGGKFLPKRDLSTPASNKAYKPLT